MQSPQRRAWRTKDTKSFLVKLILIGNIKFVPETKSEISASHLPTAGTISAKSGAVPKTRRGTYMVKVFQPNLKMLVKLGFASVAHVPVIFDSRQCYCREYNRYHRVVAHVREVAGRSEWCQPSIGAGHISEVKSLR
jgi:hypothetical protein